MNVTQKDIARRLGVSPSLVSRALRGTASDIGASDQTIQRIRREAERLGYRSSAAALALRGESTRTLGIIVKDFEDPFFGLLIGQIQRLASAQDFSLVLSSCDATGHDAGALSKYRIDGLIIIGSEFDPAGLDPFFAANLPIAQICSCSGAPGLARISMDQAAGLGRLLDYLLSLGHRDIGYLAGANPSSARRKNILQQEMRRKNLKLQPKWFAEAPHAGPDAGTIAANQLLAQNPPDALPTALIAADDMLAQSAMRALFERGYRVPHDLSIAGVDDIPSARMMIPALTTVRQPIAAMAEQAFALVTQPTTFSGRIVEIPPDLVVRESCGPPAQRSKS